VNSSKLSSWWPPAPSSLSWRAEELKELAEPDETTIAGMAKRALELRGLRQRRPLARKKVEGLARVATRRSEVDDMRRGGGGRVVMERVGTWCSRYFPGRESLGLEVMGVGA
jgi:hypothetical protein